MKKRVMLLLCTVGLVLTMTACSAQEAEVSALEPTSEEVVVQDAETENLISESNEETNPVTQIEVFTIGDREFEADTFFVDQYVDPYGRYSINQPGFNGTGSPKCYANGLKIWVVDYSGDVENAVSDWDKENIDISKYSSSADAFEVLFPSVHFRDFLSDSTLEYTVETVATETINGVEMTKFKGEVVRSITDTTDEIMPFVAYGIEGDKTPVLVFAYEYDLDREDGSYFDDLETLVDYMVTTYKDL